MKMVIPINPDNTDPGRDEFHERLKLRFPDVDFVFPTSEEEQKRDIRDADAYSGYPTREVFLAAEKLRWIHTLGIGIDHIMDIPELVESDSVVLTNGRGPDLVPHANAIADHVVRMMVVLAHRFNELWDEQKARRWNVWKFYHRQVELSGKTMGIIGLGSIGSTVARRTSGFGMRVYAVDRERKSPSREVKEVWGVERLDELLGISDWLVVSVPLTRDTRGLIDRRRIGLLKRGAYVIVVSRGKIVDEDALMEDIKTGRLSGAGLDVFSEEPPPDDSPIWDTPNVIISPHAAGVTPEVSAGAQQVLEENLRRFLAGEPFLNVPDKRAGY